MSTSASGFECEPDGLSGHSGLVVSSRGDSYGPGGFGERCAGRWGLDHLDAGAAGHLNAASGLGDWPARWARVQVWAALSGP